MKWVKIQMGCYFCTLLRVPKWDCTFYMEMYMCISFEMQKKSKKRVLNLHVIFVAVEIEPPFFIMFYQGYQKKPQKYCYRLYLNLFWKLKWAWVWTCNMFTWKVPPHLHLHHPTSTYQFFFKYKHCVFITKPIFGRKILVTYINFYVVHNFLHCITFFSSHTHILTRKNFTHPWFFLWYINVYVKSSF